MEPSSNCKMKKIRPGARAYPVILKMRNAFLIVSVCLITASCSDVSEKGDPVNEGIRMHLEYAKGFEILLFNDHTLVTVRDPLDTTQIIQQYILTKDPEKFQSQKYTVIKVPVRQMVSLSTTHLGFLAALGKNNALVGFSGTEYICNPDILKLVQMGNIQEVGLEGGLDHERILSLDPDIVMSYMMGNTPGADIDKMKALGLAVVINNEYRELSPLGQAEWIKFIAAFFEENALADSLFTDMEKDYLETKKKVQAIAEKPSVFAGMAFQGEWYVPGGKSFAATFMQDAGASYIWQEDNRTGTFPVSFETVLGMAGTADFWLHPGAAATLQDVRETDQRFAYFSAWKNGRVFNNDRRLCAGGGNDYWEYGTVYPNLVVKDLAAIFHPEMFPDHTFVFYNQLQ